MLNTIRILSAVAALLLVAGCSRSDNQGAASTDNSSASRDQSGGLSPTSRDTNASNRNYSGEGKDADNTARNARDRSGGTLTPGDQGGSDSDREITRKIRRALTTNDQFSTLAQNIKVITANGKVTLRGPVKTPQEQQAILSTVESIAGAGAVDNQLEVKATNQ